MARDWYQPGDHTAPIITAREHVRSAHGGADAPLPETCVLFEIGMAMRHLKSGIKPACSPSGCPASWRTRASSR